MSKKTVLIYGISSFVGSNIAQFLKKDFNVYGTYNKTPVSYSGITTYRCDVLVKDDVQRIAYRVMPDFTIYSVGLSSVCDCAEFPDLADALNTAGLFTVSEFAARYKSQICVISSSFVFGGENKEYVEIDIPDAITTYGKTFASSEFYIQKTSLNYIIFRCCQLYGQSYRPDRLHNFEKIQKNFLENIPFNADASVITGFLDVTYLAMVLKMCFTDAVMNRLFQVSSKDHMNYYDFIKKYAEIFGVSSSIVGRDKWPFPLELGPGASLNSNDLTFKVDPGNLENYLSIKLPTIEESLKFTQARLHGTNKKESGGKSDGVKFI